MAKQKTRKENYTKLEDDINISTLLNNIKKITYLNSF